METKQTLKLTGTIVQIADAIQGENWIKQNFLIRTDSQWPELVEFITFNTAQDMLTRCKVDDLVTVYFNLKSREHNGKFYTEATAYKIYVNFQKPTKP